MSELYTKKNRLTCILQSFHLDVIYFILLLFLRFFLFFWTVTSWFQIYMKEQSQNTPEDERAGKIYILPDIKTYYSYNN